MAQTWPYVFQYVSYDVLLLGILKNETESFCGSVNQFGGKPVGADQRGPLCIPDGHGFWVKNIHNLGNYS